LSLPVPPRPGPGAGKARLDQILRVDHAGELGAVHIYRGQRAVLAGRPQAAKLLGEMQAQEEAHLKRFDALLSQHHTRPTLLTPLWRLAGFGLGAVTALMGEKAAHACTEAVETVIEAHYASQIEELQDSQPELAAELSGFREDELAHREEALAHGAQQAPGHGVLSAAVQLGCRIAIAVSEKV
jgi:ubiquinone biosynthesis monooxygenase Coq7